MANRRQFIKQALIGAGLGVTGQFPLHALAATKKSTVKITILHTNDVHSRLDPFPADDKKYAGQGGVAARMAMINKIRAEEEHVLLFDAGDIFQGTPYFNLYKGEPEIKAMSMMGYDAATMGNHDFDAGIEGFARQLPHADFPFLIANYDFEQTVLKGHTKPYHIFNKGGIKIGVFGLGVHLAGLVPKDAYGKTRYLDPLTVGNSTATRLKDKGCDMVICLSHLGYEYKSEHLISDKILAAQSRDIDLIIGGHTHTFLEEPTIITNQAGRDVVINQVGWAGLRLGRLDYLFEDTKGGKLTDAHTVILTKKTNE